MRVPCMTVRRRARATVAEAGGVIGGRTASLWSDAWHDLRRRWLFWGSVAILLVVTVIAFATLPALAYTSVIEMLGERFHASPMLLQDLNPDATFSRAGESLVVPNVGQPANPAQTSGTNGHDGTREAGNDVTVVVSELPVVNR